MGFISWLLGNGWTPEPPRASTGLGHDHEYEEMYHINEKGDWVWKEDWYKCWICSNEVEIAKQIRAPEKAVEVRRRLRPRDVRMILYIILGIVLLILTK